MSIRELLDPTNSALIFIDHQPQMSFGVANIDRQTLKNNTVALAKAGKIFNVPVIYTSVETKSFSGYIWPELLAVHPDVKPIERTSMNSWEDDAFVAAVKATGRKKLVISALWTEVCLTFPALMALEAGYEVYVVTDTSGGTSVDAHERSIDRMVQAAALLAAFVRPQLLNLFKFTGTCPPAASTQHEGCCVRSFMESGRRKPAISLKQGTRHGAAKIGDPGYQPSARSATQPALRRVAR